MASLPLRALKAALPARALLSFASSCLRVGLLLFFSSGAVPAWGQAGGQRPAAYLELGAGGTQEAMGGAAVADRNDPACGFWNPAGLSGLRGFQVESQYTFLSQNQLLSYLAFANGFRDRLFYGLTVFYYSAGNDIEARSGPTFNPDSVFGDTEMTFMPSLAFRLSPRWSIGGSLKIQFQDFSTFSGFGIGEDLGLQYRVTNSTTLGLMIQDPLSVFNYSNSSQAVVPPTFKAGIAGHDESLSAKAHFDLEWSPDLGLRPRLGLEWRPAEVLALRAGCWAGNLTSGGSGDGVSVNPTAGFGLLLPVGESGDSLLEFGYTILQDRITAGGWLHQIALTGKFL